MDSPRFHLQNPQSSQILSPCSSGRRSSDPNSPEFEFWMVRNPSFPQPKQISADELFSDGVLLPLHLLHDHHDDPPDPQPPVLLNPEPSSANSDPPPEPGSGPEISSAKLDSTASASLTASKRWKDLFKKSDGKEPKGSVNEGIEKKNKKKKKKERKVGAGKGPSSSNSPELNINIWPFSRSRSAGNGGSRAKMAAGSAAASRKVSSAPCSRSNSAGESKSRKWPSSPNRGGVHLGRSSPVWQVRRTGPVERASERAVRGAEKGVKNEGNGARRKSDCAAAAAARPRGRVLSLNVPNVNWVSVPLSCKSYANSAAGAAVPGGGNGGGRSGGGVSGDGGRGGNLFNLRNLFTKKVY